MVRPGTRPSSRQPLSRLAELWLASLGAKSDKTRAGYAQDLRLLGTHLARVTGHEPPAGDDGEEGADPLAGLTVRALTPADLELAFSSLMAEGVRRGDGSVRPRSAATVHRVASAWNGFCRWLRRLEVLAANPMEGIERPRKPEILPRALDYDDAFRLLDAADTGRPRSRRPWPERDRALAAVLATGGLRLAEVIALRVGDVQARDVDPRLRVFGKGAKERTVPLATPTLTAIDDYLESRTALVGRYGVRDPLFVRPDGRPLTPSALRWIVFGWYEEAGVAPPPGSVVHALRHTFATQALDSGATIREVQELLGHANAQTTSRYLKATRQGLRRTVEEHPAARRLAGRSPT
jgi:integrase/recombinase XerD